LPISYGFGSEDPRRGLGDATGLGIKDGVDCGWHAEEVLGAWSGRPRPEPGEHQSYSETNDPSTNHVSLVRKEGEVGTIVCLGSSRDGGPTNATASIQTDGHCGLFPMLRRDVPAASAEARLSGEVH
jgi:hypothetical protein